MWGNWNQIVAQSEAAKEKLAAALERTGDILTEHATAHVKARAAAGDGNKRASMGLNGESAVRSTSDDVATDPSSAATVPSVDGEATIAELPPVAKDDAPPVSESGFSNSELSDRLKQGWGSIVKTTHNLVEKTQQPQEGEAELSERLKQGWGSIVKTTQTLAHQTQLSLNTPPIFQPFPKQSNRRAVKLPLDVDSLKDAEVVYITDKLVLMGHPAMQSFTDGDITPERKLKAISHLLHKRHGGRFMVWNLSEVDYDYSILDDQVLSFYFPGCPSPPLGLMLKLLMSIESWLKADTRNVAVLHCLTGKGRSSTVLAAFLCWMGEAGFHDPIRALEYISECKRTTVDDLTIPSQRRYAMYFANMLDGVRPHQPPLLLKRIIMSEAPKYGKHPKSEPTDQDSPLGCSPYIQVFKGGSLVFTTAATPEETSDVTKDNLPFCSTGPVCFNMGIPVQGDVLLRCRHMTKQGQRVSMFRAAFHTGYVPPKVLRLSKLQLDGACEDKVKFSEGFFLDLIFEECDAAMASKHLVSNEVKPSKSKEENKNEAKERRTKATRSGISVEAFQYDTMLHRDSRFWDVIAQRRQTQNQNSTNEDKDAILEGATIGKRRDFAKKNSKEGDSSSRKGEDGSDVPFVPKRNSLQSFSIGGDLNMSSDEQEEEEEKAPKVKPKQRDSLMEALMAVDDDDIMLTKEDEDEEQEILFDAGQKEEEEQEDSVKTDDIQLQKSNDDSPAKCEEDATDQKQMDDSEPHVKHLPSEDSSSAPAVTDEDKDEVLDLEIVDDFEEDHCTEIDEFDNDDEELEDLENFLTKTKK